MQLRLARFSDQRMNYGSISDNWIDPVNMFLGVGILTDSATV